MKLEKITKLIPTRYDDACGTAHGLELIGERWALLVMRELMLGPRRFGDLRASLPGISANVLTQRLEGLEAAGVLQRRKLAPPASVQVYELTKWGYEAEEIVMRIGRWGARSPHHNPELPLSAVSMLLSFKAMFDPVKAGGASVRLGFRTGAESYTLRVDDRKLTVTRGEYSGAELELSGDPGAITGAVYGFVALEDVERSGAVTLKGDRSAFDRFSKVFTFPEPARMPV
jgi:DNA-binding HxlR family transcriptional regulator